MCATPSLPRSSYFSASSKYLLERWVRLTGTDACVSVLAEVAGPRELAAGADDGEADRRAVKVRPIAAS